MKTVKTKKELQDKVADDVNDTFTLKSEMDNGEKELAWLPKTLVAKLKRSQDKGHQEKMILDFITDSDRDLQYSIESLEDDVIRYKGAMLSARKAFEDAKNEQLDANYKLWEKFDEELPSLSEKIEKVTSKLSPVVEKTEELNSLLEKLSLYKIDNYLETIEKVQRTLEDKQLMGILENITKHY